MREPAGIGAVATPVREFLPNSCPARGPPAAPAITLVVVSKLYGDFMIEIEAIAAA
jgi:enamine deaminase RidA (YjgF/YER057c/UK114 family)